MGTVVALGFEALGIGLRGITTLAGEVILPGERDQQRGKLRTAIRPLHALPTKKMSDALLMVVAQAIAPRERNKSFALPPVRKVDATNWWLTMRCMHRQPNKKLIVQTFAYNKPSPLHLLES